MTDETDEKRTCADCDGEFTLTAADREFFERRALFLPKRCVSCRRAAAFDERGRDDDPSVSQRGTVTYGGSNHRLRCGLQQRNGHPRACSGKSSGLAFSLRQSAAMTSGRLFNHDPNFVLGRTSAGTLRLSQDDRGLNNEINPPAATWAADLRESIKRGDIAQSSFSFRLRIRSGGALDQMPLREVLEAQLYDVSPVTFPAYTTTTASAQGRQHRDRRCGQRETVGDGSRAQTPCVVCGCWPQVRRLASDAAVPRQCGSWANATDGACASRKFANPAASGCTSIVGRGDSDGVAAHGWQRDCASSPRGNSYFNSTRGKQRHVQTITNRERRAH